MNVNELIKYLTTLVKKEPEVGDLPVVSLTAYDKYSEINTDTVWFGYLSDYYEVFPLTQETTLKQAQERLERELESGDIEVPSEICLIIGDYE